MASKDFFDNGSLSISHFTEKILDRILTFPRFFKHTKDLLINTKKVFVISFLETKEVETENKTTAAIEKAFQGSEKDVNIYTQNFSLGDNFNSDKIFTIILELLSVVIVEGNLCIFHANANSEASVICTVMLSYLEGIQLEKCSQRYKIPNTFSFDLLLQLRVTLCKIFSIRSGLLCSKNFSLSPDPTFLPQDKPSLRLDPECKSDPPFENATWVIKNKLLIGSSSFPENIVASGITTILESTLNKDDTVVPHIYTPPLKFIRFDYNGNDEFENSVFSMVLRVVGLIQSEDSVFISCKGACDETLLVCIIAFIYGLGAHDAMELAVKFQRKCRLPRTSVEMKYTTVERIIMALHSYKLTLKLPAEILENYVKSILSKPTPPLAKETDPVDGPTDTSHWVIFSHLVAGAYPGSYDPSEATDDLHCILAAGVNTFVNLQMNYEQRYFIPYKDEVIQISNARNKNELVFMHLEIQDMNVTTDESILELVFKIVSLIFSGKCVYVHCWGGFGRTGTLIALLIGYLYGKDAEICLHITTSLSQKRVYCLESTSPTTSVQFKQVRRIISKLNPKHQ